MSQDDLSYATRQLLNRLWRTFERYCALAGEQPLPADPATVVGFLLAERERLSPGTLRRILRAIGVHHEAAGEPDPTDDEAIRSVLDDSGQLLIELDYGPAVSVADPIPHPDVRRMVEALGDSLLDLRDRALLLTGGAARLSKAALVSLRFGDIREAADHLDLVVRHRGSERVYRLPYVQGLPDLPSAVEAWASSAGITSGLVFRSVDRWGNVSEKAMSPQAVGKVLRRAAKQAGLPPERASADLLAERPER